MQGVTGGQSLDSRLVTELYARVIPPRQEKSLYEIKKTGSFPIPSLM
jgi:hypothetical protein